MPGKRTRYLARVKARAALDAKGAATAWLATKHGIHQTMVSECKRQPMEPCRGLLGQNGGS